MNGTDVAISRIFEVSINDRLPPGQLLILRLQNVFGMTGMFVFPGLLDPSNLGDGNGTEGSPLTSVMNRDVIAVFAIRKSG
jgi:hypothetical protein